MDFVTNLPILPNWKGKNYDFILVIVNCLIKIVYYKPVKITIDIPVRAKVIINIVVSYYNIYKSIIIDYNLLFILKFWSLLYYFLDIKKSYL